MKTPRILIINTGSCSKSTLDGWLLSAYLCVYEPMTEVCVSLSGTCDSKRFVTLGGQTMALLKQLGVSHEQLQGRYVYGLEKWVGEHRSVHGFSEQLIRIAGVGIDQLCRTDEAFVPTSMAHQTTASNVQRQPEFDAKSIWSSVSPVYVTSVSCVINALAKSLRDRLMTFEGERGDLTDAIISSSYFSDPRVGFIYDPERDYVIEVASAASSKLDVALTVSKRQLTIESTTPEYHQWPGPCPRNAIQAIVEDKAIHIRVEADSGIDTSSLRVEEVRATEEAWSTQGIVRFGRATRSADTFNYLESDALLQEFGLWRSFGCYRALQSAVLFSYNRESKRLRDYYDRFMSAHFDTLAGDIDVGCLLRFYAQTGELPLMENNPISADRWRLLLRDLYGESIHQSAAARKLDVAMVTRAIKRIREQVSTAVTAADHKKRTINHG